MVTEGNLRINRSNEEKHRLRGSKNFLNFQCRKNWILRRCTERPSWPSRWNGKNYVIELCMWMIRTFWDEAICYRGGIFHFGETFRSEEICIPLDDTYLGSRQFDQIDWHIHLEVKDSLILNDSCLQMLGCCHLTGFWVNGPPFYNSVAILCLFELALAKG